ncbi:hypothetical protein ACFQO1_11910 [Jejudonia soesokkakensis]|uniref:Outer membrane protein beta-barrel domain-containing protein n=1 Tax=Jejudonia soesokkakensis TaxID=1323432 RepID=A0ABW2MTW4_9FLAO
MRKLCTLAALLLSCIVATAQENVFTAPGDIQTYETSDFLTEDDVKTFKEYSIGIYFQPIPLFINEINITQDGTTSTFANDENVFGVGIGLVVNADFEKSGLGFGAIAYASYVSGDELNAIDSYFAFKYDFALGDRLTTNFELSPLVGLGNLVFEEAQDGLNLGNSLYVSGGLRLTWRLSNTIYLGADAVSRPFVFNEEKLLGVEDEVDSAEITYKSPITLNVSLRFNFL